MAKITELIPYLRKGHTLKCVTGETLTPEPGAMQIEWRKPETKERYFWPKEYTLAEVKAMKSIWDWGVVFVDDSGKDYCINDLVAIKEAIERKEARYLFGQVAR